MRDQILKLINDYPKHYTRMIKKDAELLSWVDSSACVVSDNLAERIYSAIYQTGNKCPNGNVKKFDSVKHGYRFCNSAPKCTCASESISRKVSESKQQYSDTKKNEIAMKRASTNLKKYGVENAGQTEAAKMAHKKYYKTLVRKPPKPSISSYNRINQKFRSFSNVEFVTPEALYKGVSNQVYYDFKCLRCNTTFSDYIDNGHNPVCRTCYPYTPSYTSIQETEVFEYVKSLVGCAVEQSNKSIINPYELDIVIPEMKIAVEYCGLYWHSEVHKSDPKYHLTKLKKCEDKGYRLITIFEDEWLNKTEVVKSRLRNVLGVSERTYARKCSVEVIPFAEAKDFVDRWHIQGHTIFKHAVGCRINGDLVAIMTFGTPRYDRTHDYELIRYCSKGTVIGGASRLFSRFVKEHNPESVVSYCDKRWGTGLVYERLGFTKSHNGESPGYCYTDFVSRFHRSKYTKRCLLSCSNGADISKTERDLAKEKKLYRLWDCGQSKWEWHK